MNVYLIRHGETIENRRHIHQPPNTDLSEKGNRQAERAGKCLRDKNLDFLLTSDLPRAVQTAKAIAEHTDLSIATDERLREIRRPTDLYGCSHYNPRTFHYVLTSLWNRNNPDWHFKDAESIYEVNQRAKNVLAYFEELSEKYQNVAAVSHAVFIEVLEAFLCREGDPTMRDYFPIFSPLSKVPNGAITHLRLHRIDAENVCKWEVVELNHTAHLTA